MKSSVVFASLLLALGLVSNAQRSYVISGTLVTPGGVIEKGAMVVVDGRIHAIGPEATTPQDMPVIHVDGVVFPGLIDLHNHLVWNVLPRWKLPAPVGNRYEWQAMPEYVARLSGPEGALIAKGSGCDMERYAEVKALVGGATSVVGSYAPPPSDPRRNECLKGLARNLDLMSGLYGDQMNAEPLRYEIFPFEMGWEQAKAIRDGLGSRDLRAVLFHVGEGKDASAAREYRMLKGRGFLRPGVSVIHGVTLREADFREMAANGVGFVWSPRSNFELYGQTADLAAAKAAGVTIAIAPDWSPTGSSGMLDELGVAAAWNRQHGNLFSDTEMLQMVTSNPARLAGVSDKIGSLASGMSADFVILAKEGASALAALLESKPGSIELAVVGGKPMLGDARYVRGFSDAKDTERISVCGYEKAVNVRQDIGERWMELETRLKAAVASVHSTLAGLTECKPN